MGVLENVVILGKSGADLETELLHHETSPRVEDAQTGGADDLVEAAPAAEAVDTDTEPPQEC